MKAFIYTCFVLTAVLTGLTSCLKDDNTQTTPYSDTAITAITLGTLNRYTETTSSRTGNDTIIKTVLTGSNYKMTINHLDRTIQNETMLPMGTDVEHVVLSSISAKNSGLVYIKSLTSDTLRYLSTTDSIDFSMPRTLRVFSSDGQAYRDYTMTLWVNHVEGITFEWKKIDTRADLAGWTDKHMVIFQDTAALVDKGIIYTDNFFGSPSLARINQNGQLEYVQSLSATATWQEVGTAGGETVARLIGATSKEIIGLGTDGRLKVLTSGNGLVWQDETLDEDPSLLPTDHIAMISWPYTPADSTDYLLLAGSNATVRTAALWRKISRYSFVESGALTGGQWVFMPLDGENSYPLPRQEHLSLVYYNGTVLALGSQMTLLQSRDQGITWKKNSTYTLPSTLQGTIATMAADAIGRLWLVTDAGEIWQGALR